MSIEAKCPPDTTALSPCPFCGGPADYEEIPMGLGHAIWSVGCASDETDCIGYQMLAHFSRKCEAAAAWNTRAKASGDNAVAATPLGPCTQAEIDAFEGLDDKSKRLFSIWVERALKAEAAIAVSLPHQNDAEKIEGSQSYPTCAKCGCDTQGEAALVGDQTWCHPCADAVGTPK